MSTGEAVAPQNAIAQVKFPPTTWEQRKPHYEGLEDLLLPGFLSHHVKIEKNVICLRSPSPRDFLLLRHRVTDDLSNEWGVWALASCTWMVNGIHILEDVNMACRLVTVYRKLPRVQLAALFSVLLSLYKRMDEIANGLYSFCYEEYSRSLWRQYRDITLSDESLTGIPGTGRLGLNLVQRMWVAYNKVEDRRQDQIMEWQNAKFVASAHNPKGVKQVSQREKSQMQLEDQRRQEVVDSFYYRSIGVLESDDMLADGRRLFKSSKSSAELQDEYRRWVTGEYDQHDLVVEEYKRRVMEHFETEHQRRQEDIHRFNEMASQREQEEWEEPERVVAFDAEEMAEFLRERGRDRVRKVYDDSEAKREYLYNEHLKKKALPPPPGGFVMTKDGRPALPGAVESLDDKLSGRKFVYGRTPTPAERKE